MRNFVERHCYEVRRITATIPSVLVHELRCEPFLLLLALASAPEQTHGQDNQRRREEHSPEPRHHRS